MATKAPDEEPRKDEDSLLNALIRESEAGRDRAGEEETPEDPWEALWHDITQVDRLREMLEGGPDRAPGGRVHGRAGTLSHDSEDLSQPRKSRDMKTLRPKVLHGALAAIALGLVAMPTAATAQQGWSGYVGTPTAPSAFSIATS